VQAQRYVNEGRRFVVDVDLEKFFDRVNHDVLMGRLAKRIEDKRLRGLIRRYLEAGMMANGVATERHEGTPQGGPLSPLLANVLLDEVDKELERRGHAFVRYADDCNVYVRSRRAGERVMELLRRCYGRLHLRSTRRRRRWRGLGNASSWATASSSAGAVRVLVVARRWPSCKRAARRMHAAQQRAQSGAGRSKTCGSMCRVGRSTSGVMAARYTELRRLGARETRPARRRTLGSWWHNSRLGVNRLLPSPTSTPGRASPLMTSTLEPPGADPHAGWCGRGPAVAPAPIPIWSRR
jgi:hypothetical protein